MHPIDSIPAFVLGALSANEEQQVRAHLETCESCRAEAEAFRATIAAPPNPPAPPAHVKRQLFARIAAPAQTSRWLNVALAGALALALLLGAAALNEHTRAQTFASELAQSQQTADALRLQLAQEQQVAIFIAAPQTLQRRLESPDRRANAAMYMQPNSAHAVLVVRGLPAAAAGTTYQFWLARPGVQVPSATFTVGQDGSAALAIDAPAPVNEYDQVMVTIEASGGSQRPSAQVVLSGSLASAWRPVFQL